MITPFIIIKRQSWFKSKYEYAYIYFPKQAKGHDTQYGMMLVEPRGIHSRNNLTESSHSSFVSSEMSSKHQGHKNRKYRRCIFTLDNKWKYIVCHIT